MTINLLEAITKNIYHVEELEIEFSKNPNMKIQVAQSSIRVLFNLMYGKFLVLL